MTSSPEHSESPTPQQFPQPTAASTSMYDEFGNYIGGDAGDDDSSSSEASSEMSETMHENEHGEEEQQHLSSTAADGSLVPATQTQQQQIVLHEDKDIYEPAEQIYGEDVETMLEQEDTQPIEEPIIKETTNKFHNHWEEATPTLNYSLEYSSKIMESVQFVRNFAVCGHLHHGKTALVDLLVKATHKDYENHQQRSDPNDANTSSLRYTDHRLDESSRKISLKSSPMSLLLPNSHGKHYMLNLLDCPGHPNFLDESLAALSMSDGVLLVVDPLEGLCMTAEKVLHMALQFQLPIILVINKIDRLILELRLPPQDAYYKIRHTITQVNQKLKALGSSQYLSPIKGNVCFASTLLQFTFSLSTFARIYSEYFGNFTAADLSKRLWGQVYFHESTRKFARQPDPEAENDSVSFVHFILEPLYKMISHVIGEKPKDLKHTLRRIGVKLSQEQIKQDAKPLLQDVLRSFFGAVPTCITDAVTEFFPTPQEAAAAKLRSIYTGPLESNITRSAEKCDRNGPLLLYISKLYHNKSAEDFWAFGRVLSGTVKNGDEVKVLGPNYTPENQDDFSIETVSRVMLNNTRYQIDMNQIPAGNWVLLEGVSSKILKSATIVSPNDAESYPCAPLHTLEQNSASVLKVAVEPLNPNELSKMVDGIRKINKSYPSLITKVEESGEHVLIGTGELYMDSAMMDLREVYAGIEVKVSDPVVSFCETVAETSNIKCFSNSSNEENQLTMISEPLEPGLAEEIERGNINPNASLRELSGKLKEYDWDLLAAKSLWAFGPEPATGPNALLNETFPNQVDEASLGSIRESVVQGFRWAAKEGPLCDEPVRNVKFKLLDASISPDPIQRGSGQIIPAARRVCYSSFLTASPRMMEPVYRLEIQTSMECIKVIYDVLGRRRGHVLDSKPVPATPFYMISALVPVMDSFGLESDIRLQTQGMAYCLSTFHNWAIVPGDPLDDTIELKVLEPAPTQFLAREFMVKTRRRKGLGGDVSLRKYFDVSMMEEYEMQSM